MADASRREAGSYDDDDASDYGGNSSPVHPNVNAHSDIDASVVGGAGRHAPTTPGTVSPWYVCGDQVPAAVAG
jgi:hypothetical protein